VPPARSCSKNLRSALAEALEVNRAAAIASAKEGYTEERIVP
jgi:hypothetical protein